MFLATLTREIADESLDDAVRQLASIIFKNFIINRSKVSHPKLQLSNHIFNLWKDTTYQDYWI